MSSYSDGGLLWIRKATFWNFKHFCQYTYLVSLFENWMPIDNNWPWTYFSLSFSLFFSLSLSIYEIYDINEIHDIYDSVCLFLVSFCQSIPSEFLRSFFTFVVLMWSWKSNQIFPFKGPLIEKIKTEQTVWNHSRIGCIKKISSIWMLAWTSPSSAMIADSENKLRGKSGVGGEYCMAVHWGAVCTTCRV